MKILALDPGGTTGWATLDSFNALDMRWNCGQIGPDEHHTELYDFLGFQQEKDFVVVCERFEYRNQSRAGLDLISKEYIGVTKLFHQKRMQFFGQALVFQNASQAVGDKSIVQDRHVKKLGLWYPNARHAMDATRHLLYYVISSTRAPEQLLARELLERGWK